VEPTNAHVEEHARRVGIQCEQLRSAHWTSLRPPFARRVAVKEEVDPCQECNSTVHIEELNSTVGWAHMQECNSVVQNEESHSKVHIEGSHGLVQNEESHSKVHTQGCLDAYMPEVGCAHLRRQVVPTCGHGFCQSGLVKGVLSKGSKHIN